MQSADSIADQQRKCRERAERDGLEISPDLEFFDAAISGSKIDREGLQSLLEAARQGRIKRLYLESLSRLARASVVSQQMVTELVHNRGVQLISIDDSLDTSRDNWQLQTALHSVQNEDFLKKLAESVH